MNEITGRKCETAQCTNKLNTMDLRRRFCPTCKNARDREYKRTKQGVIQDFIKDGIKREQLYTLQLNDTFTYGETPLELNMPRVFKKNKRDFTALETFIDGRYLYIKCYETAKPAQCYHFICNVRFKTDGSGDIQTFHSFKAISYRCYNRVLAGFNFNGKVHDRTKYTQSYEEFRDFVFGVQKQGGVRCARK